MTRKVPRRRPMKGESSRRNRHRPTRAMRTRWPKKKVAEKENEQREQREGAASFLPRSHVSGWRAQNTTSQKKKETALERKSRTVARHRSPARTSSIIIGTSRTKPPGNEDIPSEGALSLRDLSAKGCGVRKETNSRGAIQFLADSFLCNTTGLAWKFHLRGRPPSIFIGRLSGPRRKVPSLGSYIYSEAPPAPRPWVSGGVFGLYTNLAPIRRNPRFPKRNPDPRRPSPAVSSARKRAEGHRPKTAPVPRPEPQARNLVTPSPGRPRSRGLGQWELLI